MSGETEADVSGWTIGTLRVLQDAIRAGDQAVAAERDRRYAEVSAEKEKALKIKETADLAALELAREIQTYKDEKANELREQISRERGLYATREDLAAVQREIQATLRPLSDYVTAQQGRATGTEDRRLAIGAVMAIIGGVIGIAAIIVTVIIATGH